MATIGNNPVWFITGCSTGFGRELTDILLASGTRVVATARNSDSLAKFVATYPDNCLALTLDVTRPEDIQHAVARAEQHFGAIDVLVNNAGYGYLTSVEDAVEKEYRAMFETNFFGLVYLTQKVLPGMRSRKAGHIVNLSSIGGLIGVASAGYYAASKFAVEGFSESLAGEVSHLGISVTAVEPSAFKTDFSTRSLRVKNSDLREKMQSGFEIKGDPRRAAQAIINAVNADQPPLHLPLGSQAVALARMKIDRLTKEIDAWENVANGADFPDK